MPKWLKILTAIPIVVNAIIRVIEQIAPIFKEDNKQAQD